MERTPLNEEERKEYRRKFEALCEACGYPAGVRPGTSMMNMPFRGGAVLTLPTAEGEWSDDARYAALPEERKEEDL